MSNGVGLRVQEELNTVEELATNLVLLVKEEEVKGILVVEALAVAATTVVAEVTLKQVVEVLPISLDFKTQVQPLVFNQEMVKQK